MLEDSKHYSERLLTRGMQELSILTTNEIFGCVYASKSASLQAYDINSCPLLLHYLLSPTYNFDL